MKPLLRPPQTKTISAPTALPFLYRHPMDLMERVALFISDNETFFAFLDAFGSAADGDTGGTLGRLGYFLVLRDVVPATNLWPRLCLHDVSQATVLPALTRLSPSLSTLKSPPTSHDAAPPYHPTPFECTFVRIAMMESSGPIIPHNIRDGPPPSAYTYLDTLRVAATDVPAAVAIDLFTYLEVSAITTFTLDAPLVLTPTILRQVAAWLHRRPVLEFGFGQWSFGQVQDTLPMLWEALVGCKTLTRLSMAHIASTTSVVGLSSPMTVETARIDDCFLGDSARQALLLGLQHVRTLSWHGGTWWHTLESLTDVLPQLVHLEVSHTKTASDPSTTYEATLALQWIATYLPLWPHVTRLHLVNGTSQAQLLGTGLLHARKLTSLTLHFPDFAILLVLEAYLAQTCLQEVAITGCTLAILHSWIEEGQHLCTHLLTNPHLHTLSLDACRVDDFAAFETFEWHNHCKHVIAYVIPRTLLLHDGRRTDPRRGCTDCLDV
ncbi:Aste57867_14743 [Aphanomyces stellatus]|uniref:Aste57867_14743 protein n=1 Tax=Aphanomyces stellatus TaxID=120398 RepID=A0A485L1G9_9STRA|nr:hypothetical protein As57867_014688 [Aphanomyces stellatus]VFT91561.1 Aste57867_14743 [Aphanomyces stellatus]